MVGLSEAQNKSPLEDYWQQMAPGTRIHACQLFKTYPDFMQNMLSGAVNYEVTPVEASEYLRRKCG